MDEEELLGSESKAEGQFLIKRAPNKPIHSRIKPCSKNDTGSIEESHSAEHETEGNPRGKTYLLSQVYFNDEFTKLEFKPILREVLVKDLAPTKVRAGSRPDASKLPLSEKRILCPYRDKDTYHQMVEESKCLSQMDLVES